MSWLKHHRLSEKHACQAELYLRQGDLESAANAYHEAAVAEQQALDAVAPDKTRTLGLMAVGTVALYYKARRHEEAQNLAHSLLAAGNLPEFAELDIQDILVSIWDEAAWEQRASTLSSKQLEFTLLGYDVHQGAAPIQEVERVTQNVGPLLHRVAELANGNAFRLSGRAPADISNHYRTWAVQTPPGSYRFAIALEGPREPALLPDTRASHDDVVAKALEILDVGAQGSSEDLKPLIPDPLYRKDLLELARDLSPIGHGVDRVEIRGTTSPQPVALTTDSRDWFASMIRATDQEIADTEPIPVQLHGSLRALNLERHWIQIFAGNQQFRITEVADELDDEIASLTNQEVVVAALRQPNGELKFQRIAPTDKSSPTLA